VDRECVDLFRALADPNRLLVAVVLASSPDERRSMSAANLLKNFSFSQPTLSHHMKILCEAGIVESEKIGRKTYYRLNDATLDRLEKFIKQLRQA
jgi:ArsR family transcriptional regulator